MTSDSVTSTGGDQFPPRSFLEQLVLDDDGDASIRVQVGAERRVFGGMLVAQALRAAQRTVGTDRRPHSMHASFVGSADGRQPVRYEVERTRDGRSFSTRRVAARQGDGIMFVSTVSFHVDEDGPRYELPAPLDVPSPDACPLGRYASPFFDSRDVPTDVTGAVSRRRLAWFRARAPLSDDLGVHEQGLAYLSDHGPTRAIRQPHADHPGVEDRMSVSLNHAVWFHRPARVDDWLLSELSPMATGAGRGLAVGSIRTADGIVVATVAQEALLRLPS